MAIQLHAADAKVGFTQSVTATLTVSYCSNIAAGDLLLLHLVAGGNTRPAISGWTEQAFKNTGSNISLVWYGKEAAGSESGSLEISMTSSNKAVAHMLRITGHRASTYWDKYAEFSTSSTTTYLTAAVTTSATNTLVIYTIGVNADRSLSTQQATLLLKPTPLCQPTLSLERILLLGYLYHGVSLDLGLKGFLPLAYFLLGIESELEFLPLPIPASYEFLCEVEPLRIPVLNELGAPEILLLPLKWTEILIHLDLESLVYFRFWKIRTFRVF